MSLQFSTRVLVFANDALVYRTHQQDAARLVRDGLAVRRDRGSKVRAINLVTMELDCSTRKPAYGNPQKYTFLEALQQAEACQCSGSGCLECGGNGMVLRTAAYCHAHKPGIAHPRNWPIFRAALVDCLPPAEQSQIREIFAKKASRARN